MTVREFELSRTDATTGLTVSATVSEIGASIRALTVGGVDLVQPYRSGMPPLSAGVSFVPWPNRIEDGTWLLNGVEQQLQLTDPVSRCAINGFLDEAPLELERHSADHVCLTGHIVDPPGYPFRLRVTICCELTDLGIRVRYTIENLGNAAAPVALGAHPYLTLDDEPLDKLVLTVPALEHLPLDDRNLPGLAIPVNNTAFDLRGGARVTAVPDHIAYAKLKPSDGLVRMRLRGQKHAVELWADPDFAWAQIYRTDAFPGLNGLTSAIAIEPMTAPANAFRSGHGVRWLQPGARWCPEWGISLRP